MKVGASCSSCDFWHQNFIPAWDKEGEAQPNKAGQCRIKAPYHNGWPSSMSNDWCAEWASRTYQPPMKGGD